MQISIVTLFPSLYQSFIKTSLIDRAIKNGQISISFSNLFDFVEAKQRIDGPTYGHNSGMLLKPTVVEKAINKEESLYGSAYKIFFSPHGRRLDQNLLKQILLDAQGKNHIMMLPARYEGMDSRVEDYYSDIIVSLGDFVLMGGDIPAMACIEGLLRLIPGIVGKQDSVEKDSFSDCLVDYPEYTSPEEWQGLKVPEIIKSGDHQKIADWQKKEAIKRTVFGHFDWLKTHLNTYTEDQDKLKLEVAKKIVAHYVVLMHDQIMLENGREGTSSVTSIDVHDIARSSATYGVKKYFIVTPLEDQQKIIAKLLSFWESSVGINYNSHRHEAMSKVVLVSTLAEAISFIKSSELLDLEPVLITTAAKKHYQFKSKIINYFDQEKVWSLKRPVVLIFGTARGLSDNLIDKADFLLRPVEGFSKFNHLSVRSAVAIVLDRWLGINYKL